MGWRSRVTDGICFCREISAMTSIKKIDCERSCDRLGVCQGYRNKCWKRSPEQLEPRAMLSLPVVDAWVAMNVFKRSHKVWKPYA